MKIEKTLMNFIIIFTLLSLMIVPFASATLLNAGQSTGGTYEAKTYALVNNVNGGWAQSFAAANTGHLKYIDFYLKEVGDSDLKVEAYLCSSTTGAIDGYANMSDILATSTSNFTTADMTSSLAWYQFDFDGTYHIVASTVYFVVIGVVEYNGGDTNNYISVSYSSDVVSGDMRYPSTPDDTIWESGSSVDLNYKVFVETDEPDPEATPTPAPSTTATPNPQFTQIWDTLSNLINLLIPLLCVVLPAFFGYKFAGAWGFLAGINIGAILAYVILGTAVFPLWGIVVILILDALLLFGKVGFHS